ncbi:hypothetical protein [Mesorhizobium sp. Root157]|uniref:hypothetical protein n=1 Tax=Mesorhizobium sp. Root157 TaxID=1736477 RepID=UPI0009EB12A8|nr:hypothetical protein [Mesorhizobium sp. Root157]
MTATTLQYRSPRPHRREAETHLFAVGLLVRLKSGFGQALNASDIYRITGTLPPRGNSFQYRIRNDEERYERVVTQDSLEQAAVTLPEENSALIERTFNNGQGTEAQQSRDQKTEAGESAAQA